MNTESQGRRTEMLAEYYKLIDMLQDYDKHFLSIKNWSVTLSGCRLCFRWGINTFLPDRVYPCSGLLANRYAVQVTAIGSHPANS